MTLILNRQDIRHIHFIGIGGIGMSGLAEILLDHGYTVSGSDQNDGIATHYLRSKGAKIFIGHDSQNIVGAEAVIYSSAIQLKNPEFQAVQKLNIPLLKRGQLLAELMNSAYGIAISGTHGKTTTTGLITFLLNEANFDPTSINGGLLQGGGNSPVRIGQSKYFIVEADESDASFLYLKPKIAVVTNIEADHLNTYSGDFGQLKNSFFNFLNSLPNDGFAVCGMDDPCVYSLLKDLSPRVITFGFHQEADICATDFVQNGLQTEFKLKCFNNQILDSVKLNLPGRHNVENALAAIAVAYGLGIDLPVMRPALFDFPGIGRRFNPHGDIAVNGGKALLFDDYGHHPSEIKATIEAARQAWPKRRLVVVFQPHRYSRTQELMSEFADVLATVDELILVEVYSAGEDPIDGADSQALCRVINNRSDKKPRFVSELDQLPAVLSTILKDNDIVFLQGAGSIGPMANILVKDKHFIGNK